MKAQWKAQAAKREAKRPKRLDKKAWIEKHDGVFLPKPAVEMMTRSIQKPVKFFEEETTYREITETDVAPGYTLLPGKSDQWRHPHGYVTRTPEMVSRTIRVPNTKRIEKTRLETVEVSEPAPVSQEWLNANKQKADELWKKVVHKRSKHKSKKLAKEAEKAKSEKTGADSPKGKSPLLAISARKEKALKSEKPPKVKRQQLKRAKDFGKGQIRESLKAKIVAAMPPHSVTKDELERRIYRSGTFENRYYESVKESFGGSLSKYVERALKRSITSKLVRAYGDTERLVKSEAGPSGASGGLTGE
jgi:hypothetical protein